MNPWLLWLQTSAAETLASTLLHTLWQATLAAALLAAVLRQLPACSSRARYRAAVACLAGVLVSALVTWSVLRYEGEAAVAISADMASSAIDSHAISSPEMISTTVEPRLQQQAEAPSSGKAMLPPRAILLLVWIVGAMAFLLRAGRSVAAAQRLAQGPLCTDPRLLAVLEEVRRLLGMTRRVRMVFSDCLQSPVVVGVLQPTLVLPASLMTGLTPDDLRALFAHELAHIRRHDYLINLLQLLVESLLFFNPAVWWISRQVRAEREACCDQLAVGLTNQPLRYAQLLADWATRMRETPSRGKFNAAIALANGKQAPLLDRIRRILSPGEHPVVRLSWATCVGFLLLSLVGLALLQRGADLTVSLAAQLLTDEQRVAVVTEAADQYGGGAVPKENRTKPTITGRIVTADGKPYEGELYGSLHSSLRNSSASRTRALTAPDFRVVADPGMTWLQVVAPGYAPAIVGPFDSSEADHFGQVEVVLRPGVSATVRVVDEKGQGVPDAKMTIHPVYNNRSGGDGKAAKTDEEGYAELEHLNRDFPYRFYVTAPGFQRLQRKVAFAELDGLELMLEAAQPVTGKIVDQQGEPIAGATLKTWRHWRPGHTNHTGAVLATTDVDGQFTLDQLADGWVYDLLIEVEGFGSTILTDVKPGSSDRRVLLTPALTIRGRVEGTAEQLAKLSKQRFYYEQQFPSEYPGSAFIQLQEPVDIEEVEGEMRFQVTGLAPVKTLLKAGDSTTLLELSLTESLDDVVVSLHDEAPFEMRQVVVRFTREGQPVKPTGLVKANIYRTDVAMATNETYPLIDGELHLEALVPGKIQVEPKGMLGYWIPSFFEWPKVTAGEEPLVIDVPVYPAGAVQGQVLIIDGLPAVQCGVSVRCKLEISAARSPQGKHLSTSFGFNTKTDSEGRFFITPVPIGAESLVSFGSNHYKQVMPSFSLKGSQPTETLALQLGEVATAQGVLLLPSGQPAVGLPVRLSYRHPDAGTSYSPAHVIDAIGRFSFEGLRRGATEYVVEYKTHRDYLPASVALSTEGKSVVLQLTAGKILEGVAIDQATDRPVAGVRVYAHPVDWDVKSGEPYAYEAEGRTDAEGRFRFSNLPNRTMALNATELWLKKTLEIEPGGDSITLRAQVADWYREKLAK